MVKGEPDDQFERVLAAEVDELDLRIRSACVTLAERARAAILLNSRAYTFPRSIRRGNQWVDASKLIREFSHLRLKGDARLACLCSTWLGEQQSKLLILHLPPSEPLPMFPPPALGEMVMPVFGKGPAVPSDLPSWVDLDVLASVQGDGSALSLFERCLLLRWAAEPINSGHGVFWGRCAILAGTAQSPRVAMPDRMSYIEPHADWGPRVFQRVSAGHPILKPPQWWDRSAAVVLPEPIVSVVEFFSYTAYVRQTRYRHRDCFAGEKLVYCWQEEVARGGPGYLV